MKKLTVHVGNGIGTNLEDLNSVLAVRLPGFTFTFGYGVWNNENGKIYDESQVSYVFLVDSNTQVKLILGWFSQFLHVHTDEEAIAFDVQEVEGGIIKVGEQGKVSGPDPRCKQLKRTTHTVNPGYRKDPIPRDPLADIGKTSGGIYVRGNNHE